MTVHAPGIWSDDDGNMHFEPGPWLRSRGLPDTLENRDEAIECFKEVCREKYREIPIVEFFDAEPPKR